MHLFSKRHINRPQLAQRYLDLSITSHVYSLCPNICGHAPSWHLYGSTPIFPCGRQLDTNSGLALCGGGTSLLRAATYKLAFTIRSSRASAANIAYVCVLERDGEGVRSISKAQKYRRIFTKKTHLTGRTLRVSFGLGGLLRARNSILDTCTRPSDFRG